VKLHRRHIIVAAFLCRHKWDRSDPNTFLAERKRLLSAAAKRSAVKSWAAIRVRRATLTYEISAAAGSLRWDYLLTCPPHGSAGPPFPLEAEACAWYCTRAHLTVRLRSVWPPCTGLSCWCCARWAKPSCLVLPHCPQPLRMHRKVTFLRRTLVPHSTSQWPR
jgi:hypothetical protein